MVQEIKNHLINGIIPFWKNLRDNEYGGYYGYMDYNLKLDKKAPKGCILNSRILWFFANAYSLLNDKSLLDEADHAYEFMRKYCIDSKNGGIYWSMKYNGEVEESIKHTYNQAFAIYALSSYYEASGRKEALDLAIDLFLTIEKKCTDSDGYLEALDEEFVLIDNDKLSENGVMASRTMNTLLHVLEAYTELYRVSSLPEVKEKLFGILDIFASKVYNPILQRQEVFFDSDYNSILDLHSYGHDIETSWLLDRTIEIIDEPKYTELISPITKALTSQIYNVAFNGESLAYECDKGIVNDHRVWWVQAETVVGFINGYMKNQAETKYLEAAKNTWRFISEKLIDKRPGSEWFYEVLPDGTPCEDKPILEPWKCPYHNGRMCFEVIKRGVE